MRKLNNEFGNNNLIYYKVLNRIAIILVILIFVLLALFTIGFIGLDIFLISFGILFLIAFMSRYSFQHMYNNLYKYLLNKLNPIKCIIIKEEGTWSSAIDVKKKLQENIYPGNKVVISVYSPYLILRFQLIDYFDNHFPELESKFHFVFDASTNEMKIAIKWIKFDYINPEILNFDTKLCDIENLFNLSLY